MAYKLVGLGEEDLAAGRELSAGNKFKRSASYYQTGERMQAQGTTGREETYRKAIDNFLRGVQYASDPVTRVTGPRCCAPDRKCAAPNRPVDLFWFGGMFDKEAFGRDQVSGNTLTPDIRRNGNP